MNFDDSRIGKDADILRLFGEYLSDEKSNVHRHAGAFIVLWISGLVVMRFLSARLKQQIAEREATERSLRQSEKKYSTLVEDLPVGIYIVNNGAINFANQQACRIYGYSREEMTGMDSALLVHPEERTLVRDLRKRRIAGEIIPEYQVRGIRKDGTIINVRRKHTVIEEDCTKSIVAAIEDVTELIEARASMERSTEELKKRNRELDLFARTASHDLREPLRKICIFSDLLISENLLLPNEPGIDYVERIQKAAERMNDLIEALLSYSRIGRMNEPLQVVDLREAVTEALKNLEIAVGEADAKVTVDSLPLVKAERLQMVQLFQNLISNSLKFRHDSRKPFVKICPVETGTGFSNGEVGVRVEDNGIGFDTDSPDNIFQPFVRLHSDREGSGIGLAICRKIVEDHGGKISASSQSGKGTTITVILPTGKISCG